ncbi:MAG: capsule assembly Wzi family protein [Flavobacteriaceae bacterium]
MKLKHLFFVFFPILLIGQNINLNNDFNNQLIRYSVLKNEIYTDLSFNVRPLDLHSFFEVLGNQYKTILSNPSNTIQIKTLGIDYFIEYNSHHPYNRNNGTMIPNRGYQHIISPGIFIKTGPLTIQFKPEHHFSENKEFDGFWEGHYSVIWAKRYKLWNKIDMPERFGNTNHNKTTFGQSSIRLNWKSLSLGVSNENLWWGPSLRNSIMMSNHAEGFRHITFNTSKPIKTFIGNFEWQVITGRLESSGFTPSRTDIEHAGTKLYIPKINQLGRTDDWRYLQGYVFSYSPKWIDGLSLGLIRWVQMYSALVEGKYWWMEGNPSYFPAFQNLFRSNDKYENYEAQTNQAAGVFLRWIWKDSKAEIYAEFHHNDSKQNLRDLLLDSDHSRAATIGLQKIFNINNDDFLFNWEWTQMEQTGSRLIRGAGSWYEHGNVFDGYTNKGEVLGSSIGPGSNSHYFSLNRIRNQELIGIGLEIVDNDNDFYHEAFASARDYRRYWKDINLHLKYNKSFKYFNLSSNLVYTRSLNYQWELDDFATPYYHPGRDVDNFHISVKLTYFGNW